MVRIKQIIKSLACAGVITAVAACGAQRKGAASQDAASTGSVTANSGSSTAEINSEAAVYNRIHFGLNLFSKAVADKNLASGNVVVSPYRLKTDSQLKKTISQILKIRIRHRLMSGIFQITVQSRKSTNGARTILLDASLKSSMKSVQIR